ncbi:hypothetical protein ACIA58_08445 [Kribbella sp. NPDC051586]|uniref:hypothetical protein n=1 Tax=Kribbella sp. NPDC051586 TaxID=3364118 RepID=UPI003798A591
MTRVVTDGPFWLEYGQIYVVGPDESCSLQESFAGQRNGLCGAAVPGRLFLRTGLHTGKVELRVEVHDRMPSVEYDAEDVVEASYLPPSGVLLTSLGYQRLPLELEQATYRVRYSAWGMDAGHQAGPPMDGEPLVDRYLLQFWPARPAPERVVKQTSKQAAYWHDVARASPTPEQLAEQHEERERQQAEQRIAEDAATWGGRLPSERLLEVRFARELCGLDRPLVDALERADEDTQRAVARWAARRTCTEAGYLHDENITRILDGMDRGDDFWPLLYPPNPDPSGKVELVFGKLKSAWDDAATPLDNVEAIVKQTYAEDPLRAAVGAIWFALGAFSNERLPLAEVRLEFGALMTPAP